MESIEGGRVGEWERGKDGEGGREGEREYDIM